jgi:hypothetical protein
VTASGEVTASSPASVPGVAVLRRFAAGGAMTGAMAGGSGGPAHALDHAPAARPDEAAQRAVEQCEMCRAALDERHGHLVDVEQRSLVCACRACFLLFTAEGAARGRYRAVGERVRYDPAAPRDSGSWAALQIPVGIAFFFVNSALGHVVASYPGPAGATECELDLSAWDELAAGLPLLRAMKPDVEAILMVRGEREVEAFLVPVDACYSLAGRLRVSWRGFDGGAEARQELDSFLAGLRQRAAPLEPED